ncbi:dTDP-4-dehydrorhamnose reductase family protein [Peteryoungia algae]|uniref:dTDP-4-dehydrorhamnose reductase n=1 Tax=Peteryoungia algae TaxID=2919917 RepID=A0ABT0CZW3_9HYPH|nr:SDR family oxidoreductase [Rhizobium sp. SSM4.3]MCJ8238712.1 SDR family oxidoreductase [Rhizobium sp. SSM4.3]
MRILVLGASGMLGNAMVRVLSDGGQHEVYGTLRSEGSKRYFQQTTNLKFVSGVDAENFDLLASVMAQVRPQAVINCIGLVKQLAAAGDPLVALPINSILPHRLARLCDLAEARLVHVSTDCVFAGLKGMYTEDDKPDAADLYGRSKLLGEVDYPHAITLRTSIIGHELGSCHGLVEWFLAQDGSVEGYKNAIFSGLPTCELARVVRDVVLPRPDLSGLYHVAAQPISKYDLLELVNRQYAKGLAIHASDRVVIDRSLSGSRFNAETGYIAPSWDALIAAMHAFK